jgi:hypothetical protein
VRSFYELKLPNGMLTTILIIVALAIAGLATFWLMSRRQSRSVSRGNRTGG